MNIAVMLAHAVEEFDQVRLLSELGYSVFSIGAYSTPACPGTDIRPALPQVADYPELRVACELKRIEHGEDRIGTLDGLRNPVDWAKADLPDELIEWADVIICHHLEHTWLVPQWNRIRHKQVIWRTVGQSVEHNEAMMTPLRAEGLQIIRYSPKERNIPGYCGEDALIRFYKDPDEWNGWTGEIPQVINFTQNLRQRDPYTNWGFWDKATRGLPAVACGPGSEEIGGAGEMSYPAMREMLRASRAYLYTGTQPASYTLGLIEAMMVGIPVVSIGPAHMQVFSYGPELFEGHEIVANHRWSDSPGLVRNMLSAYLSDIGLAKFMGDAQRECAIELFGKAKIAGQWKAFFG